jgi:hypothetical protein
MGSSSLKPWDPNWQPPENLTPEPQLPNVPDGIPEPAGGFAPSGQGFSTGWQSLPASTNIEDRRSWNLLGYDDQGDAFSRDGQGNVWVQPWQPYGNSPGWGDAVNTGSQSGPGGRLHTDEPTVDQEGHAHFHCGTCANHNKNKKKKNKKKH